MFVRILLAICLLVGGLPSAVHSASKSHSASLIFSPDGSKFIVESRNEQGNSVFVGEVANGRIVQRFGPFKKQELDFALSPDGHFAAIQVDRTLKLYNVSTGNLICERVNGRGYSNLKFSPHGQYLSMGVLYIDALNEIRGSEVILRVSDLSVFRAYGHIWMSGDMAWTADGQNFAIPTLDEGIMIHELSQTQSIPDPRGFLNRDLAFSPNGEMLSMTGAGGATIRDLKMKQEVHILDLEFVQRSAWSPNGKLLALVGESKKEQGIYIWEVENRRLQKIATGWVEALTFSPDGKSIYTHTSNNRLEVYDLTGQKTGRIKFEK